jgi:hypothetical protein
MLVLKVVERRHELLHPCGERCLRVIHPCEERRLRVIQPCEERRLRVIHPCEECRLRVIHPCDDVIKHFVHVEVEVGDVLVGGVAVVTKLSVGDGELFVHGGAPCVEVF